MLVLSTQPENILCTQFESDAVIYPTKLRSNVLTTCNVDNIDHNQSCLSAKDSWHGTAVSSTEHFESKTDGQTGKALFYPPRRFCSLSQRYTRWWIPFFKKSTGVYVPRLPKRRDLAPFGISQTRYLAIEEEYFFMQKT